MNDAFFRDRWLPASLILAGTGRLVDELFVIDMLLRSSSDV